MLAFTLENLQLVTQVTVIEEDGSISLDVHRLSRTSCEFVDVINLSLSSGEDNKYVFGRAYFTGLDLMLNFLQCITGQPFCIVRDTPSRGIVWFLRQDYFNATAPAKALRGKQCGR